MEVNGDVDATAADECAAIDRLEDSGEHEAALRAIDAAGVRQEACRPEVRAALLWRAARARERLWQASRLGSANRDGHYRAGMKSAKDALGCISKMANEHAETTIAMTETTGKVHKWMAKCTGQE